MTKTAHRPYVFGPGDRAISMVQESEVAFVAINDASGNPIFIGRAKVGTVEAQPRWQIKKITYDANNSIIRIEWPENSQGNPSNDFEFRWSSEAQLEITAITQANPGEVTVSSTDNLADGDKIIIQGVLGMTEVNFDGSNIYTVANLNAGAGTFELQGIDTTGFGAYVSGGSVEYGEVVNNTYG